LTWNRVNPCDARISASEFCLAFFSFRLPFFLFTIDFLSCEVLSHSMFFCVAFFNISSSICTSFQYNS
jgi:hypothetical protein